MLRQFFSTYTVTDYLHPDVKDVKYDCGLGTNPFLDEQIIQQCMDQLRWTMNAYTFEAYEHLKDRLADYWSVLGVTRKNIALGSGSFGLMRDTCAWSLDRGGLALGYAPQFTRFESEVWLRQAHYRYVEMSGSGQPKDLGHFQAETFIEAISEDVNLVYLDNPNNPTGQIIGVDDIATIVEAADRVGAVVLVDEAYGDYMDTQESAIALVGSYQNLVVIRSASKFFGLPNHRVGYVFAHESLIDIYDKIGNPFPFTDFSARVFCSVLDQADTFAASKIRTAQAKSRLMMDLPDYAFTSPKTPILAIPVPSERLASHGILAEGCSLNPVLGHPFSRIRIHPHMDSLTPVLIQCYTQGDINYDFG